jgi:hypothetical protein
MNNKFRFWAPKAFDWTLDPIKYIFLSSAQEINELFRNFKNISGVFMNLQRISGISGVF